MNPTGELAFDLSAEPLWVEIGAAEDGLPLSRERVNAEDMSELVSEMWLAGYLRRGWPGVPLDQVRARVIPRLISKASPRCSGFALEVTNPSGRATRHSFTILSLGAVSRRAATRLIQSGKLGAGDRFLYRLVLEPHARPAQPIRSADEETEGQVEVQRPALSYASVALPPLLDLASVVHPGHETDCYVFYTQSAFAKAERYSREGGARRAPVESGGVLVGSLCASPCGEFFVVVTDVLKAVHAEQTTYSLGFTDQTWGRIQDIISALQRSSPERACRLLGNCHGHNFMPYLAQANDPGSCPNCDLRGSCTLTSVFVSKEDQDWSRAVFPGQPWQLTHIFGLTPRGEPVHTLYGLRDGGLQPRGFHLLPDFALEPWRHA